MVFVKPFGPHHCATCLGSVHASNTRSRGASMTRVVTISGSAVFVASLWLSFKLLLPPRYSARRSKLSDTPDSIPVLSAASRASFDGSRTVCVIVVLPSSSERIRVLRVSGQSPPHDSVETSRSGGVISRYTPRIPISVPSERRQTKCHIPPARRSISQTGMVQPLGPNIQCGRCLGSVQASKTSLRGASTTRAMTISRSDGVVNVVARTLCAVAMSLLPSFQELYRIDMPLAPPADQRDEARHLAALDMAGHDLVHAAEPRLRQTSGAHLIPPLMAGSIAISAPSATG